MKNEEVKVGDLVQSTHYLSRKTNPEWFGLVIEIKWWAEPRILCMQTGKISICDVHFLEVINE